MFAFREEKKKKEKNTYQNPTVLPKSQRYSSVLWLPAKLDSNKFTQLFVLYFPAKIPIPAITCKRLTTSGTVNFIRHWRWPAESDPKHSQPAGKYHAKIYTAITQIFLTSLQRDSNQQIYIWCKQLYCEAPSHIKEHSGLTSSSIHTALLFSGSWVLLQIKECRGNITWQEKSQYLSTLLKINSLREGEK